MMAVSLLIVECKMLYAHCHSVLLHLLDIWNSHLAGKIRVLSHVFEVAAAQRSTINVYTWSEKYILFAVACLLSNRLSI